MHVIGLASCFATAAPALVGGESAWVASVLRELGRSQVTGLVWDLLKWSLLGAGIGLVVSVLACGFFSKLGWYDVRIRFARGLRWSVFVVTVLLVSILMALVGFWSGAIAGTERVLTRSQLATDVFPKLAEVLADGMAWVQWQADDGGTNTLNLATMLEEFRAGRVELHAARFLNQLDHLTADTLTNAIARLEQSALQRIPQLKGTSGERLLHRFFNQLGRLLIEKQVSAELQKYGADRVYFTVREQLTVEAQRAGNPDTLPRAELARFLLREGIVPGVLQPVRATARSQQVPLLGIALLVVTVPPVCARLAQSRFGRTAPPASAPPVP